MIEWFQWITENEELVKQAGSVEELAELLRQNGLEVSAEDLAALAEDMVPASMEDGELTEVSGGVLNGQRQLAKRFWDDLVYRPEKNTGGAETLVYKGQPYTISTLELRPEKNSGSIEKTPYKNL